MNKAISFFMACMISFFAFGLSSVSVHAESMPQDVEISVSGTQTDEGVLVCSANVNFNRSDLINDGLRLSYHITDDQGNMIQFENDRFVIDPLNEQNNVDFRIDYRPILIGAGVKNATICFDIVDENNGFWYSLSQYTVSSDVLEVKADYDANAVIEKNDFTVDGNTISCTVSIDFHTADLINDGLELSYHVTDIYGNMLQFENRRYPIDIINGKAVIPVTLDVSSVLANNGLSSGIVIFDIVDTKNLFWYFENTELMLETERITAYLSETSAPIIQDETENDTSEVSKVPSVSIISNLNPQEYTYDLTSHVTVFFDDETLYNDSVKLSYRVYDEDMNVISEENERFDLVFSEGKAETDITLSLTSRGVHKGQNAIVVFDMVDEKNIFWFSQSDAVKLNSQSIQIRYDWIRNLQMTYLNLVKNQPIQLAVNIIIFIGVIIVVVKFRKILND